MDKGVKTVWENMDSTIAIMTRAEFDNNKLMERWDLVETSPGSLFMNHDTIVWVDCDYYRDVYEEAERIAILLDCDRLFMPKRDGPMVFLGDKLVVFTATKSKGKARLIYDDDGGK